MELPSANQKSRIAVFLIDDQQIVIESVREMLKEHPDIEFYFCTDPRQAIPQALQCKPTVILQDLLMPQVDGMTLVRYFRGHPETKDIPLIVLSSKEEAHTKAESFALGADDYLVKLPDKIELIARIRYHSLSYTHLLERNEAYRALQENQAALLGELREAADYVESLLPAPMQSNIHVNWKFIPSTQLGGDSFGYHWLDENQLVIYLLDVCGHGVGAALLSVSVMNVLRSQTLVNTDYKDPAQVLSRLNESFPMEDYNNMYFTIWYGVYNRQSSTITYSCAGHPPAVLITGSSAANAKAIPLQTPGFIIGGMPDTKYINASQKLDAHNLLYIFSDGVYELDRPNKPMMQLSEFIDLLADISRQEGKHLDKILESLRKIQNKDLFEDDFSIIEIQFNQKD
jgi:sigma-B regulation protein RsbU (phosphoserine phosphatase)